MHSLPSSHTETHNHNVMMMSDDDFPELRCSAEIAQHASRNSQATPIHEERYKVMARRQGTAIGEEVSYIHVKIAN